MAPRRGNHPLVNCSCVYLSAHSHLSCSEAVFDSPVSRLSCARLRSFLPILLALSYFRASELSTTRCPTKVILNSSRYSPRRINGGCAAAGGGLRPRRRGGGGSTLLSHDGGWPLPMLARLQAPPPSCTSLLCLASAACSSLLHFLSPHAHRPLPPPHPALLCLPLPCY